MEHTMSWLQSLSSFISAVFVAVITATLTVRLALRRFYSEKWWEQKNLAYTEIIKALHHVREYADTNLQFTLEAKELPVEGERQLTEKMKEAIAQLRLHRDLGAFVICDEAVKLLNQLFRELDASTKTDWWQEHLEMKVMAVDKCLKEMRLLARNELKIG